MLNSAEWKYFKLEDLFDISLGKHKKKEDLSFELTKTHNIPYITSSSMNNGVDGYFSESNAKNVITVGTRGSNFAFYHKKHIFASGNTAILKIKDSSIRLNEYRALFIIVIINNEQYRWSYGFNPTLTRLKRISIKLPVDSEGEPNWDFMEEYMRKISKGNLEGFNLSKDEKRLKLNDREWDNFKLEDLFDITSGKYMSQKKLSLGNTPFVTATTNNNGVSGFYDIEPIFPKNSITIEKVFAKSFYQPKDFYTTGDVNVLYNNKNINKYTGLFISNIITYNESGKWNYGRQCRIRDVKEIKIKLPIKPKSSPDEKSEPDWEFMENYIKGLPYTNKL